MVENEGCDMKGCGGGSSDAASFFLCWRRKTAPRTMRAMRAIPPMTPPTMAPTGVGAAVVATGGAEEVAAPATAVLVADEVVFGAAEVEDEAPDDVDDDCEAELVEDVLLVVVLDALVVVEVTLTVDMVLVLSSALVVCALSTPMTLLVPQ